jgi:hypothetical protein
VSEVGDWILPDLDRHIMGKKMEQCLLQMMERFLQKWKPGQRPVRKG